jgi:hypothetical protein
VHHHKVYPKQPDLNAEAKRIRESNERDTGGDWWDSQAMIAAQWIEGQPPPKDLVIGDISHHSLTSPTMPMERYFERGS